jgi:RimJ/RimL family protein N-acetyltransferase
MSHLVYRLVPRQYPRYREHLLALDEESRYLRFGYQIKDEMINRLCDSIEQNPKEHKLFVIENDNLETVAVGHISVINDNMELAFSVHKQYQGKGMGSALMARCVEWCQNRYIRKGMMVCLSVNKPIRRLASKHGILIHSEGETTAEISIPEPNPISIWSELIDSNLARMDHMGKVNRYYARKLVGLT